MPLLKDPWIFLPMIPYFAIVFQNAPNIPIMDDYDAILSFLNDWKGASWGERPGLLFSQSNEHRLLYSRIVFSLYYSLTGSINFRYLILLADLQLVLIALVSAYFIRRCAGRHWKIMTFLWTLCLFDLNTYESGSIAMYGMQNYGILLLFFTSLLFYSRGEKWIVLAAMIQIGCIFSSGNGMIGALFITLYTLRSENEWKKIVAIVVSAVCIPVYFIDYTFISQPNKLPFDIGTVAVYFIRMCGAHFSFEGSLILGLLVLLVLAAVFPYEKIRSDNRFWPMLCILGFLLVSMGTASLFRACLRGAQFQTSRYLIYPQLVIIITTLFAVVKLEGKKIQLRVLIGSALLLVYAYSTNFEFGRAGFGRTAARAELRQYWHPEQKRAALLARTACENGIYCIEDQR